MGIVFIVCAGKYIMIRGYEYSLSQVEFKMAKLFCTLACLKIASQELTRNGQDHNPMLSGICFQGCLGIVAVVIVLFACFPARSLFDFPIWHYFFLILLGFLLL